MEGLLRWRVEVTRDRIPHIVQRLEWALQHQNRRFTTRVPTHQLSLATRRKLVLALSSLGLALVLVLWTLAPRSFARNQALWFAAVAFFVLAFITSFFLGRLRAWSRRYAGRLLAQRAARLMRPLADRLPAVFDYELHADHVAVQCNVAPGLQPLPLAQGLVLAADDLLVVFRRRSSLHPTRKIHIAGTDERRALLDAFARHGTECIEITGPTEGYADPLPPARVR